MASDINDDAELIPDHNEAWSLAIIRRGQSNIARAYIELRELARKEGDGPMIAADIRRLHEITHANDV